MQKINGTPYPYQVVEQRRYRFRILSIANDRGVEPGIVLCRQRPIRHKHLDPKKQKKITAKAQKCAKGLAILMIIPNGGVALY